MFTIVYQALYYADSGTLETAEDGAYRTLDGAIEEVANRNAYHFPGQEPWIRDDSTGKCVWRGKVIGPDLPAGQEVVINGIIFRPTR